MLLRKQTTLDTFLRPVSPVQALDPIPHREIVIKILQLGIAFPEKALLRAVRQEISVLKTKGRVVAPITLQKLRQQMQQLAREGLVEKIGFCWRMPY